MYIKIRRHQHTRVHAHTRVLTSHKSTLTPPHSHSPPHRHRPSSNCKHCRSGICDIYIYTWPCSALLSCPTPRLTQIDAEYKDEISFIHMYIKMIHIYIYITMLCCITKLFYTPLHTDRREVQGRPRVNPSSVEPCTKVKGWGSTRGWRRFVFGRWPLYMHTLCIYVLLFSDALLNCSSPPPHANRREIQGRSVQPTHSLSFIHMYMKIIYIYITMVCCTTKLPCIVAPLRSTRSTRTIRTRMNPISFVYMYTAMIFMFIYITMQCSINPNPNLNPNPNPNPLTWPNPNPNPTSRPTQIDAKYKDDPYNPRRGFVLHEVS